MNSKDQQALVGATIWEKFPAAVGTVFDREYHRAISQQTTVRFTEFYPLLDYWVQVNAYPTADGLAVYFRDVSAEIAAEQELRLQKERLDLVIKATNDVIWDWDLAANKIWWSESYTEQFGHARHDQGDDPSTWSNHIHSDDYERVTRSFYAAMEQPDTVNWAGDYRFLKANGSVAYVVDSCYLIRDQHGQPIRIIGSLDAGVKLLSKPYRRQELADKIREALTS